MPLTLSQRLTLMKAVATRLSAEEWSLIDVTLTHFGLPTVDRWEGEKSAYVLHMIEKATDLILIELAQHVGHEFDAPQALRVNPPFWQEGMFRVFVSHLASERAYAAELQEALLPFGVSCFVAHNDIQPTEEWITQIDTALATCDALVALMHEGFHQSLWTDQEIGFAMGRGVPTYAVRFSQDPYGFIGKFQAFGGKAAPLLARELFDAYRRSKQTQRRISEMLLALFERSPSFAEAKVRIGYLEELEVWDGAFSARIKTAVQDNSQIKESWGVPERVAALANKWAKIAS